MALWARSVEIHLRYVPPRSARRRCAAAHSMGIAMRRMQIAEEAPMTANIHIHRLRRAWETSDGVRCTMAVVYTKDLRHALERLDALEAIFEDWRPYRSADCDLKDEAMEIIRG